MIKQVVPLVFPIVFVFDFLVILLSRRFSDKQSSQTVVFVRTDNLGDFILWLPIASALRDQWPWPGHRFVLIANDSWAGLANSLNLFDRVISIDRIKFRNNLLYRARAVCRLARMKATVLVTPIHSRDPLTADSIARAVDATRRVAAQPDSLNAFVDLKISNAWYHELIPTIQDTSTHESIRNAKFVEHLAGVKVTSPWHKLTPLNVLPNHLRGIDYAVIAPGVRTFLRAWPADFFSRLIDKLSAETSLEAVLVGTALERDQTSAVVRACAKAPIDLTARLSFDELICVLGRSRLIVTNETGIAHLGAAVRVPTVVIVGGGHFGRFFPYPESAEQSGIRLAVAHHQMPCFHCNWQCVYPVGYFDAAPCVSGVTLDDTWSAVEALLK